MVSRAFLILLGFATFFRSEGQTVYSWEDSVRQVSEAIMLSDEWTARAASLEKMPVILSKALDMDGSFGYAFDSSRISIVYAPDSSFRILTGQAVLEGDDITYYGLLQRKADERNPIFFKDDVPLGGADVRDVGSWDGAVYYNLEQVTFQGLDYYLLFGFSAKSFFESSKTIEVLYFEDGLVKFGAPLFFDRDEHQLYRFGLTYASDVGARLNYDSTLEMIIFDNLIPMKSPYKERKVQMVPDGSYSGFRWEANQGFVFVDKIFDHMSLEAPREKPVLDAEHGKDLFGRAPKRK